MNSEEATTGNSESVVEQETVASAASADSQGVESQEHQDQGHGNTAVDTKETIMAAEQSNETGAIELSHGSAVLGNRPIGDDEFAISGTMTFSGVRPIEVTSLEVYDTMMGGRPIEASHLAVVDTETMPGHRPIFASTLAVVDADSLPGHRPIAASPDYLMHGSESLPNNRPIATNAPDAGGALMGFLD